MSVVTEIKQNVKNKNKVSVFADGEFLCSVTAEAVAKLRIKVGDDIDENTLKKVLYESDCQTAFSKAVDSVCRSIKTQKQIEKYLYDKGYSSAVVQTTIDKMKEYHYVDDGEFVRSYVSTYQHTKGKKRIGYELKLKGLEQEYIDLVDELIDDQQEDALAVAKKFFNGKEHTKENIQKLYRHLANKGFDFDVCRYCSKSLAEEVEEFGD